VTVDSLKSLEAMLEKVSSVARKTKISNETNFVSFWDKISKKTPNFVSFGDKITKIESSVAICLIFMCRVSVQNTFFMEDLFLSTKNCEFQEREMNSTSKQDAEISKQRLVTAGRENERLRKQVNPFPRTG
jgi:hypothetical protein